jgi:uroporphyrinogen-III synthase
VTRPLVIVTRPKEEADQLSQALERMGCDAINAPMLEIRWKQPAPAIKSDGVQAWLVTSANGARCLAAALGPARGRELPVFAVGEASAEAARGVGFKRVEAAGGDVTLLVELVAGRCDPAKGRLIHAAGSVVAGDLQGTLSGLGFSVERIVLYDARPVDTLPPETATALREGRCAAVLFFSPRTAERFVTLIHLAGLGATTSQVAAMCLSDAVAHEARTLRWRRVVIAAQPKQSALIASLRAHVAQS